MKKMGVLIVVAASWKREAYGEAVFSHTVEAGKTW